MHQSANSPSPLCSLPLQLLLQTGFDFVSFSFPPLLLSLNSLYRIELLASRRNLFWKFASCFGTVQCPLKPVWSACALTAWNVLLHVLKCRCTYCMECPRRSPGRSLCGMSGSTCAPAALPLTPAGPSLPVTPPPESIGLPCCNQTTQSTIAVPPEGIGLPRCNQTTTQSTFAGSSAPVPPLFQNTIHTCTHISRPLNGNLQCSSQLTCP